MHWVELEQQKELRILGGSEISPYGSGVAAFLLGEFSHSGTIFSGLNGP